MKQKDSLTGLSTGYGSKNKLRDELNKFDRSNTPTNQNKIYPSGIGTSIFLAIITVIALGLALGLSKDIPSIKNENQTYLQSDWFNIIFYVFGAMMCIIGLVAINRSDFLITIRFGWMKFLRTIRVNILRQKMFKNKAFAIDDVNNIDEFKDYLKQRNKSTKRVFFVTLYVYLSLFIISLIIMLCFNFIK